MKITVTGSLGHISSLLIEKLVAANKDVTVVSSNIERAPEIEKLGAKPAIGSVDDPNFLVEAFAGADAIYTMVPPTFQAADWKQHIAKVGQNYADAILKSGVKFVVNLSSIGAHLSTGAGPVSGMFFVEEALNRLGDVNVKHLRPASFYINYYSNIDTIKQFGIMGNNYSGSTKLVLVDVGDIADAAFHELTTLSFRGKSHRYIASEITTGDQVAEILGNALGKPDLKWMELSDENLYKALNSNGLPAEVASNFIEMGKAVREGRLFEDYGDRAPEGKRSFAEFAEEFAKNVHASAFS